MGKERESANLVSTLTGIAVTLSGDPVVLGIGSTEHLRLHDDGRIGLGTNSAIAKLDIRGGVTQDGGEECLAVRSSDPLNIPSTITTGFSYGTLQVFGGGMGGGSSRGGQIDFIGGQTEGDNAVTGIDTGALLFRTGLTTAGGTSQPERVRISAAGLVGIGTSGPGSLLHALGSYGTVRIENNNTAQYAASGVELKGPAGDERSTKIIHGNSNAGGTETYFQIEQYNAAGSYVKTLAQYGYQYDYWLFNTGGSERLRIDSDGKIGIGTDSPDSQLTIADSSAGARIEIKRTNANAAGAVGALNWTALDGHSVANIFALGDGDDEGAHLVFRTTTAATENSPYGSGTIERVRITSTGLLGIGTDAPATPLSVAIGSSTFEVHPHLDSGTTLTSFNRTSNSWQDLRLRGYSIKFSPQGNEKARLNSDGRFGIGTTSPGSFLHVQGDSSNTLFRLKRTDAPAQILNDFGSGDSALKYTVNDASSYILGVDDSDADRFKLSYGSSDDAAFGTNDLVSVTTAGNLEVDSGDLTLNGNLVGAINVTVADDAFASITPPRDGGGWVFLTTRGQGSTYPWSTGYGFSYLDWGASPQVSANTEGGSVNFSSSGPPNGTTGTDERVTVFTGGTAGTLYVENRLGATYSFQLTFI